MPTDNYLLNHLVSHNERLSHLCCASCFARNCSNVSPVSSVVVRQPTDASTCNLVYTRCSQSADLSENRLADMAVYTLSCIRSFILVVTIITWHEVVDDLRCTPCDDDDDEEEEEEAGRGGIRDLPSVLWSRRSMFPQM